MFLRLEKYTRRDDHAYLDIENHKLIVVISYTINLSLTFTYCAKKFSFAGQKKNVRYNSMRYKYMFRIVSSMSILYYL